MESHAAPLPPLARALLRVGAAAFVAGLVALATADGAAWWVGESAPAASVLHAPFFALLRASLVMIAAGAGLGLAAFPALGMGPWRFAVGGAAAMLVCSLLGEAVGALAAGGFIASPTAVLGEQDSVERRLFRLAMMAARAVPVLALLAALSPRATETAPRGSALGARAAWWTLHLQPLAFLVGATTLPAILALSAFVHREIAWTLPLGADTSLLGCAAAAIAARRHEDRLAYFGWLTICVSMGAGLLMGAYAFGGPMPAPAAIGDYATLTRTLMRDAHVVALGAGLVAVVIALSRKPPAGT